MCFQIPSSIGPRAPVEARTLKIRSSVENNYFTYGPLPMIAVLKGVVEGVLFSFSQMQNVVREVPFA